MQPHVGNCVPSPTMALQASEVAFIWGRADKAATVALCDCAAICQTCHLTQSPTTTTTTQSRCAAGQCCIVDVY